MAAASFVIGRRRRTFSTPEAAAQALTEAAGKNDTAALLNILGPAGESIVVSGDAAADKEGREDFARRAREKLTIERPYAKSRHHRGGQSENGPFPYRWSRRNGQWMFDAAAGKVEVLARRVGRNELNAIDVCRGYVEAQMKYAQHDRTRDGNAGICAAHREFAR